MSLIFVSFIYHIFLILDNNTHVSTTSTKVNYELKTNTKIIGGTLVSIRRYPYMVKLLAQIIYILFKIN